MNKTPYDTILESIEKWSRENFYGDFLVTISIDGFEMTEFLEFDPNGYVWENDWWEGQEDVKLLGFMPIDNIRVHGFPAADVQPVTHGKWEEVHEWMGDVEYSCSVCGCYALWKELTTDQVCTEYCPHCGAKMDGGDA